MSSTVDHTPRKAAPHDRTHYLYVAVIVAVGLGIVVGFVAPELAVELKPLGQAFVGLIKMMIQPVIFCTIVLGVGSVRSAARVGKVGGLALGYFLTMSTFALAIGLVVGNLLNPGSGLNLTDEVAVAGAAAGGGRARDHLGLPARDHPDVPALVADLGRGARRRCSSPCSSASRCRRWARPVSRS